MHEHVDRALDQDHKADPYDQLLRAGICRKCRKPTREPLYTPSEAVEWTEAERRAAWGDR